MTLFWRLLLLALLFSVAGIYGQDQSKFWPELDTYVNLNSRGRFFFMAQLSNDQDTLQIQAVFLALSESRHTGAQFLPSRVHVHAYVRGELAYDSRYDKIAKNSFTVGSVFPITKRTEFQLYYEDQRD